MSRGYGDPEPLPLGSAGHEAGHAEHDLVLSLNSALRVSRLHALDNPTTVAALEQFAERLQALLHGAGQVALVAEFAERCFRVNDAVLACERSGQGPLSDFLQLLEKAGLGALIFRGRWDRACAAALAEGFNHAGPGLPAQRAARIAQGTFERLPPAAELELIEPSEATAGARALEALRGLRESGSKDRERLMSGPERADWAWGRLIALGEAGHRALAAGQSPLSLQLPVRIALIKAIEALELPGFLRRLLGLTVLQPGEDEDLWAAHAARVTALALGLGHELGLNRRDLLALGLAAFHHDLGRPSAGRAAALERNREARDSALGHLLAGVRAALPPRGLDRADLVRLFLIWEHHRPGEAYPEGGLDELHPLTAVLALADAFDRLETGTPWAAPLPPALALQSLRTGGKHDPGLVELLERLLGRLPRGTLLATPAGELLVVVDGGPRRGHVPVVRRLLDREGQPDLSGRLHELADPASARVVPPQEVTLDWRRAALA